MGFRFPVNIGSRLVSFAVVGIACTIAFAVLYGLLRTAMRPFEANLAALSITIVGNFAANRWLTFRAQAEPLLPQMAGYMAVYMLGLTASSLALLGGLEVFQHPPRAFETLLAIAASGLATVIRFVLLSAWVFRRGAPRLAPEPPPTQSAFDRGAATMAPTTLVRAPSVGDGAGK